MTDEIVKYHNDLNAVIMRGWTSEEMNFFFAILSKAKEKGTKKLTFYSNELKMLSSSSRKYRWEDTVVSATKKIAQLTYFERKEASFRVMTLFDIFEVNLESQVIDVQVSSNFDYILNNLQAEFTIYELAEFTRIKSTYAKTMYRLLKQWRTVGKREFGVEEFKTLLDTPKSYKTSEIDRAVVKPILKELSPFFKDLKVKKVKAKTKGTPVKSYIFNWTAEEKRANRKEAEAINGDSLPAPVEVPVFDSLEAFFGAIEGISVDNQKAITDISSNFEPTEALAMLSFAESLRKQKAKSAIAYTIKVIKEWAENGVKTLEQAKKFHEVNYSQKAEPQAKKPKKKGGKKQASGESNIPHWSDMNPENANKPKQKPTQEDLKKLIELQKQMKVYNTPKAKKEREDWQKQIDEAKAEASEK